jgi:hypothetical protein
MQSNNNKLIAQNLLVQMLFYQLYNGFSGIKFVFFKMSTEKEF